MRTFLDTNVFLYAFLDQDAAKKMVAVDLLARFARSGNGFVSLQVVKEFCNVMIRRSSRTVSDIADAIKLFEKFGMASGSLQSMHNALVHKERYGIQFYDALMIAAAEATHCETILTEDLNDGQVYAGVKAVNPFRQSIIGEVA